MTVRPLPLPEAIRHDDLYDEGWAGTVTTDRILATIGGILGGALTCLALLIKFAHHSNTAAAKGHRP